MKKSGLPRASSWWVGGLMASLEVRRRSIKNYKGLVLEEPTREHVISLLGRMTRMPFIGAPTPVMWNDDAALWLWQDMFDETRRATFPR